jgi:hypothetical protein
MTRFVNARRWAWAAALLAAAGCDSEPKVYPVRGAVTFEGKPMRGGGSISFVPTAVRPGRTAGGEIAEDGTFELSTHKPGDGSMEGPFRVVIHQVTEVEPVKTRDGEKAAKAVRAVAPEDRIPTVYGDQQKSPLTATVTASGGQVINFDLKRKP